ncbi:MAG: hypothetical protein ACP5D7_03555 [Limnospira sp.]
MSPGLANPTFVVSTTKLTIGSPVFQGYFYGTLFIFRKAIKNTPGKIRRDPPRSQVSSLLWRISQFRRLPEPMSKQPIAFEGRYLGRWSAIASPPKIAKIANKHSNFVTFDSGFMKFSTPMHERYNLYENELEAPLFCQNRLEAGPI